MINLCHIFRSDYLFIFIFNMSFETQGKESTDKIGQKKNKTNICKERTSCSTAQRFVPSLASTPSRLGSNPDPAINRHRGVSQAQGDSSMCVNSLGWTLSWVSCEPALVGVR